MAFKRAPKTLDKTFLHPPNIRFYNKVILKVEPSWAPLSPPFFDLMP